MMMMMMKQVGLIFLLTELTQVSTFTNYTACKNLDRKKTVIVTAGESLYLQCPNLDCYEDNYNSSYVWFKNLSKTMRLEKIGTEEHERVHYHRSVLYILQLTLEDTGHYITQEWYKDYKDPCHEFELDLVVYEEFSPNLLNSKISISRESSNSIPCPVCESQKGTFIWYKNFSLISSQESGNILRISNASKEIEGIYTCVCTWEHHGRKYNSSASRLVYIKEPSTFTSLQIILPINNSILQVDMGTEIVLTCSVFTGSFGKDKSSCYWKRNGTELDKVFGYKLEYREDDDVIHAVLTISEVSQVDLLSVFQCTAEDKSEVMFVSVTLKSKDVGVSSLTLISVCVCVLLLFLLITGAVKMFAVDLVLLVRGIFKKLNRKEDGKVYDAYVIYQRNNLDETSEKTLSEFIHEELPTVLEKNYGYKLYIPGRDDLPGEDCMNLIETKIELSRRLIFMISPGNREHEHSVSLEAYDVQVGLHQALVQGDTAVILIQLEEIQDYTHLPLGLQHLLKNNPPLQWRDGEKTSSRFWKQVRYRLPVPSCQKDCLKKTSVRFNYQKIPIENEQI
ncbi:interleukin-1 receptor-like 1 isoform X2 [Paramisgurnus dabryanus]|uniref:interleukin-1 receptor-like 1 isoform X2 n=1 Tax=Paramisgurnus dabryanus TaxID=90735 RepID=UPI0031F3D795